MIQQGDDINQADAFGESLLARAVDTLCDPASPGFPTRYERITFALDNGADPTQLDHEGCGPLLSAMLWRDAGMIDILSNAGADANAEVGFSDNETLLDWALFDYRYENFLGIKGKRIPLMAMSAADKASVDAELGYIRRVYEQFGTEYGYEKPDFLDALRKHGAKTWDELMQGAGPGVPR